MNIAIVGTGNVGGALAKQWAKAGHDILLGARDLQSEDVKNLLAFSPKISAYSIKEAAKLAEVILIAAVPQATQEIAEQLGDVSGKIIIDAMNSVRVKPEPFANTFEALKSLTNCPNIAKCFNTTGFENMGNPSYQLNNPAPHEVKLDMFVATSSVKAKLTAQQLAKDAGFGECYDFGGDDKVQLLEYFALSWINLAIVQGHGREIAFKIIKRS